MPGIAESLGDDAGGEAPRGLKSTSASATALRNEQLCGRVRRTRDGAAPRPRRTQSVAKLPKGSRSISSRIAAKLAAVDARAGACYVYALASAITPT
jgi:hypothetical protein